jgi:predicted nucleotidyltransferase
MISKESDFSALGGYCDPMPIIERPRSPKTSVVAAIVVDGAGEGEGGVNGGANGVTATNGSSTQIDESRAIDSAGRRYKYLEVLETRRDRFSEAPMAETRAGKTGTRIQKPVAVQAQAPFVSMVC